MSQRITMRIEDGVADVRLARPERMNALDLPMFDALIDAGAALARDGAVRAVVLSGEGRAFCAGLDMAEMARLAGTAGEKMPPVATRTHGIANRFQQAVMTWRDCPIPVIAAMHGVAFGGGFQLALGADIRYVTPDVKMAIMEIKWGLVPDMGGILLAPRLARDDILRELTYTGRVFSGREALEYGFATRVADDPLAAALATAREIASRSPTAVEAAKRLFERAPDLDAAGVLAMESAEQDRILADPNQREAVTANMEKRPPRFRNAR